MKFLTETTSSGCEQPIATDRINYRRLIRGVAGTAGVRLAGLALAFVMNLVLARILGVREYGTLMYILAWVGVLSVVGMFGLDRLLVREVANYNLQAAWGHLRGLLRWAYIRALLASLVVIAVTVFLFLYKLPHIDAPPAYLLPAASCLLLCTVMMRVSGSTLQGFHRVVGSQLAEILIQPGLCIVLIASFYLMRHSRLLAHQALMLNAISAGSACVFVGWLLWRTLPPGMRSTPMQFASRRWMIGVLPLFLASILDILNNQISSLLLGTLSGTTALGMYSVAERGAQLVVFPLSAINLTLAPTFANLYHAEDIGGLQRLVTKSARLILISAAPIALALILGGHWFLQLFGRGFTNGHTPLVILCIGQLMNAAMGSVGNLLIMTGHGREAAIGVGIGVGTNLLLSALFIPLWGASGAAVATASSLIVWNVLLALFVWKRLGIATTALGRIGNR